MKLNDLRTLDDFELLLHERDVMEELLTARFQHHTSQLQSTAKLRSLRRDMARIKTVIRQREIERKLPSGALRRNVDQKELRKKGSNFSKFRARFGATGEKE